MSWQHSIYQRNAFNQARNEPWMPYSPHDQYMPHDDDFSKTEASLRDLRLQIQQLEVLASARMMNSWTPIQVQPQWRMPPVPPLSMSYQPIEKPLTSYHYDYYCPQSPSLVTKEEFLGLKSSIENLKRQMACLNTSIYEFMEAREENDSTQEGLEGDKETWESNQERESAAIQPHDTLEYFSSRQPKVNHPLVNSNLKTNVFVPFPSNLESLIQVDEEKGIALEFNELENEEGQWTREEDIDSDEEAAPLENCENFDDVPSDTLSPQPSVGEDDHSSNVQIVPSLALELGSVAKNNLVVIPFMENSSIGDPDFLGVEAFLVKFDERMVKRQFIEATKSCILVKELPFSHVWIKAKFVCPKTLSHKPLTSTTMALATLAIHGVPLLRSFFPLLFIAIVFHCPYIFAFESYLLFSLQWQDPP